MIIPGSGWSAINQTSIGNPPTSNPPAPNTDSGRLVQSVDLALHGCSVEGSLVWFHVSCRGEGAEKALLVIISLLISCKRRSNLLLWAEDRAPSGLVERSGGGLLIT